MSELQELLDRVQEIDIEIEELNWEKAQINKEIQELERMLKSSSPKSLISASLTVPIGWESEWIICVQSKLMMTTQ